ncbi:hypothetical protein B0T11DRAFT_71775 [Plectosphaerella cucumerina]|uniref:Uncharacterized protein n=1 Tax=Plectosphaerella cucumerina TaxID=40658 RepID=A0A8K0X828_9PEZI|nr:hypothetical protein B0T11DRAFT_71775 [Plectosphaerella cucumerina]
MAAMFWLARHHFSVSLHLPDVPSGDVLPYPRIGCPWTRLLWPHDLSSHSVYAEMLFLSSIPRHDLSSRHAHLAQQGVARLSYQRQSRFKSFCSASDYQSMPGSCSISKWKWTILHHGHSSISNSLSALLLFHSSCSVHTRIATTSLNISPCSRLPLCPPVVDRWHEMPSAPASCMYRPHHPPPSCPNQIPSGRQEYSIRA